MADQANTQRRPFTSSSSVQKPMREKLSNAQKWQEGVDFSEGGWTTADFAAAILGLCSFISSEAVYPRIMKQFRCMHAGTAVALLFGGVAHQFFPNRAINGVWTKPAWSDSMSPGSSGRSMYCARSSGGSQ